jgi:hypothetical protein
MAQLLAATRFLTFNGNSGVAQSAQGLTTDWMTGVQSLAKANDFSL